MIEVSTATPDYIGVAGKVWKTDLQAITKFHADKGNANVVADNAQLAGWIVFAPWAHPLWHSYAIAVCHLRDVPGQTRPAVIRREGATHEFMVYALDPDQPRTIDEPAHLLHPGNFVAQLVGMTDEDAVTFVRAICVEIADGRLNPDTDARSHWIERFGSDGVRR